MLIQITDAGLALMEGATQPIVMTSYQLGSSFGYTPSTGQTALQGTVLYTGVPSAPVTAGINTLLYACYVPGNVGPFQFGEIGLFYNTTLFAIVVLDELVDKAPLDPNTNTGGPVVVDFFVPITSTNYQMWANATQANTLKASTVTGPEGLPPSPNAVPNVFVVEPAGVGQTFLAFSDRFGVWSFTGFGEVANAQIVSADANSVTVPTSSVASITYQGLGTLMTQFTSGAGYSTTRYIDAMTPSGPNTVLSFNAPLTIIPNAGDSLVLYEPLAAQTPSGSIPPGVFTTLTSSGNTSLGPTQAISINNTPIGATAASSGRFTTLQATGTTTLAGVTATSLDGAVIGATTPAAATVTTLVVTTSISGPGLNTLFAAPGPIGATTPASGKFTTLQATGATTLAAVTATSLDGAAIGVNTPSTGKFTTLQATGPTTLAGLVNSGNSVLQAVTATNVTASGTGTFGNLIVNGTIAFTAINATPVGTTTPAAGAFTTLSSTGNTTLGATTTGALTATSINSTPIGATTPSTGKFTTLNVTGASTFAAVSATSISAAAIDSTPIGAITPATGAFTSLSATGAATIAGGLNLSGTASALLLSGSPGATGQILISQGPGATPIWTNAVVSGGSPSFAAITVTGTATINTVRASAIENSPIGATTPATGNFTTLQATTSVTTPSLVLSGAITLGASVGTAGQVLLSAGAGATPTWGTAVMAGSSPTFPAITVSGTATIATSSVTTATITTANVNKLVLTANQPLSINGGAGTNGQVLTSTGPTTAPAWTNLSVTTAAITSGTINGTVIGGVTPAAATFTSVNLNGLTSPMLLSGSAGTLGQVLTSQGPGATPIWTTPSSGGGGGSVAAITSGTIDGATIGGSNPANGTFNTLVVQNTSSLNVATASSVTTSYLVLNANNAVSVNGSTGTAGQVLTSTGTTTAPVWATPTAPSAAAITSGTITGVAITGSTLDSTPIGLTTPSVGNFTTIQAINIDGAAIGSTTASTAAFTSLSLVSTTSPILLNSSAGTVGQVLTSQGPGATPIWTTVSGGGTAAITGGTIDGATIGATTPSTGKFTTLSASGGLTLTGTNPILLGASAGTAGQVLTSQGPGAAPTWTTVSGGGGTGTVTSITASGGLQTTSGTPITTSGTIQTAVTTNALVGTTYTLSAADRGINVTFTNASPVAVTVPQAGTTGFEVGFTTLLSNLGAGPVTVTPTTSSVNGLTSLVIPPGSSLYLISDGTNYRALLLSSRQGIEVNAQTGTSYTYVSADRGRLITHNNAASVAASLPQAVGAFGIGWSAWVRNIGTGLLTITPTTSTIDGLASLSLNTGQAALIISDGTNYQVIKTSPSAKTSTLTDATTISVDASVYKTFRVVLAGNRLMANPTGLSDGDVLNFRIKQDATGSRTLSYDTLFKFAGGVAPTLSTAPNSLDFMSCQYDATDGSLICVLNKAFA